MMPCLMARVEFSGLPLRIKKNVDFCEVSLGKEVGCFRRETAV